MANQRFDVLSVRKFKTSGGEEKSAWTNLGVAFANRDDQGFSISLHAVPVPDRETGEIRLVMRIPQPREEGGGGRRSGGGGQGGGGGQQGAGGGSYGGGGGGEHMDDDIPFAPRGDFD